MQLTQLETLLIGAAAWALLAWVRGQLGALAKKDTGLERSVDRRERESRDIFHDVSALAGRMAAAETQHANFLRKFEELEGLAVAVAELKTEMRQVRAEMRDMSLTFREWLMKGGVFGPPPHVATTGG